MTRRDYVLLASALNDALREHQGNLEATMGIESAAHHIANVLADENLRFDRDRFVKAAGVQK